MSFFLFVNIKYIGDNMSKESFKIFAKNHPELADKVLKGTASWQQLYELYEIYGEQNQVWNNILDNKIVDTTSFKEVFNTLKNLDMDSVQKGITNLQKTISILQDIGLPKKESTYEPRPIYKRFED